MSRFDELDKKVHFRLSDALYQGLRDIIGTSLPVGKDLEPISDRKTLKSRKFLIEEAKAYHEAVLEIVGHDLCPVGLNPEDGCGTFAKCIEEAERYVKQCERIAAEGWFLSGDE